MRTNEQILKKAIEKVVENGWNSARFSHPLSHEPMLNMAYWLGFERYFSVIFSRSFAKAFWGENKDACKMLLTGQKELNYVGGWQYHLQQMVLEEKPLKYIEKFI